MNGLTSGIFHLLVFGTQIKCGSIFTQWVSHLNVLGHCKFVQTDTLVWRRTAAPNLTNICSFSFWQKNTFQVLMNWKENNITLKKQTVGEKQKQCIFLPPKKLSEIGRNIPGLVWQERRAGTEPEQRGKEGGGRSNTSRRCLPLSLHSSLPWFLFKPCSFYTWVAGTYSPTHP